MPFVVSLAEAQKKIPHYKFVSSLTASEQKCAFQVVDGTGQTLCLKILKPGSDPVRVEREILAMQAISHPNVVRFRAYHTPTAKDPQHYIVENFVPGSDLAHVLGTSKWQPKRACRVFAKIFDGLAALQAAGLVHRDLKPTNIRMTQTEDPVIIDFGLVRHLGLPDLTKTNQGAAIGTPTYFAPEQFDGNKYDIDSRTDFFAAGVLLHMALLGRHPFAGSATTYDQLRAVICTSISYASKSDYLQLPDKLQLLISRLLMKQRLARPSRADTVAGILRKIGGV